MSNQERFIELNLHTDFPDLIEYFEQVVKLLKDDSDMDDITPKMEDALQCIKVLERIPKARKEVSENSVKQRIEWKDQK